MARHSCAALSYNMCMGTEAKAQMRCRLSGKETVLKVVPDAHGDFAFVIGAPGEQVTVSFDSPRSCRRVVDAIGRVDPENSIQAVDEAIAALYERRTQLAVVGVGKALVKLLRWKPVCG